MAVLQPLTSTTKLRLVQRILPVKSLLKLDSEFSISWHLFHRSNNYHTHVHNGYRSNNYHTHIHNGLRKVQRVNIGKEALWGSCTIRSLATKPKRAVQEVRGKQEGDITVAKKVAQAGKDVTYLGVIVVGLGITALMFFTVGKELFSSKSPNVVYTRAFKLCKKSDEVTTVFGLPLKGYGEMNRRRRRRHVSHFEYEKDGVAHMRVKFYIEGPDKKGTVNCEVRENDSGDFEYRYLFVQVDGYPPQTIVLEDNR